MYACVSETEIAHAGVRRRIVMFAHRFFKLVCVVCECVRVHMMI